ncbi:MAG: SDR family NAD(P)-dependent oxidoreductase [Calditrichaeota bacterium]|nr:MAG: SDR family NAD(P)-dependent oxidoreductase [Calditrichota bacterium]
MDFGIKDKHAFVAAASRGLGYAAAFELAQEGTKVTICGRDKERIEESAARIAGETGSAVVGIQANVAVSEEIKTAISVAGNQFGPIDILVTNAGGPPAGSFNDMDESAWEKAYDLTLMSSVRLIQAVLPVMQKRGWGRIVNITSISVKQPIQGLFLSNALRPGVIGMAKSLADEVAKHGITVNNVCPGWTDTERVQEIMQARAENAGSSVEEQMAKMAESVPAGRMGRPEELAALIAFLCSTRASYITGSTIQVDGGSFRGLM